MTEENEKQDTPDIDITVEELSASEFSQLDEEEVCVVPPKLSDLRLGLEMEIEVATHSMVVQSEDERPTVIPPTPIIVDEPDSDIDTTPYPEEVRQNIEGFLQSTYGQIYEAALQNHMRRTAAWKEMGSKGEPPKMPDQQKYFDAYLSSLKKN